ncbi:PLP-dependent aminotransferase family protein [Clostridium fermenticellae]|uniref:PLP-dependent aminotransferase family protein n=1 Tax=Clostridium fermenticellae TaxID=2068654 RepID=A0A386H2Q0_9CLOT|nr:PLP-dependent aminotransferase family protein [Clostridium fermenticellae]AYD39823.1 PLP-dependent aminotransferase family protein [Clostridium fermenticellae]
MDKYFLKFSHGIPKYVAISNHIKRLIDNNEIKDGEKLPPIRKLAEFLEVNNITIVHTYNVLKDEGYAVQKIGSGTYAKRKDSFKSFRREYSNTIKKVSSGDFKKYIDFTGESPCSDFFPVNSFKDVLNEVLDRDGVDALSYQEALGYAGLRKSISKVFWNDEVDIDDILIISGAQQGIDIISKALINTNDSVLVEMPTYSGALSVFKWRRANICEIPVGFQGININKFEKILRKNNIKCFYTMSYFQNPTGISYSRQKKEQILRLADIYDFYIIEDDYLSELIYDKNIEYATFKSLDRNDRVIYIKSFSKIFLPGIRIGYLIPPKKFKESIQNSKVNTDISTSSLMQRALDLYITKGLWKEYIDKLNKIYSKKYLFMKEVLTKYLYDKVSFIVPGGGLHFYVKINDRFNINSIQLFRRAKNKNVLIMPGTIFYKESVNGLKYFKLGFSQIDKKNIENGIKIIGNLIENYRVCK